MSKMSNPTLPPEIITEILSHLTVKPLARFKSVSKPWKTLISSPNFVKLHLSKTLISHTLNPNFIFSSFSLAISSFNDSILRFTELHHPLLHSPDCFAVNILGSCNGIICYGPFDKAYACFYNPSIGSHRILPPAPSRFPVADRKRMFLSHGSEIQKHVCVYGFGYDANSGDYKLLKMLEYYMNSVFVGRENCVYSLINDSWKFVNDNVHDDDVCCGIVGNECAYLDGVLYFIVDNNGKDKSYIKCFNLRTETFSVMELPKHGDKCDIFDFKLIQVSGRLCVMVHGRNRVSGVGRGCELVRVEMWIMKECWVRLFCISDKGGVGTAFHIKPLVLGKDGRTVLVELDGMCFGWFDWVEDCFERVLANGAMAPDNTPFDTWTYVETLVSVGRGGGNSIAKAVSKKKKKSDVDAFLSSGFKLRL